jgi:hypothetical protein
VIFKPHDRFDHAAYIADSEPLDLRRAALFERRKDQNPFETFGHVMK